VSSACGGCVRRFSPSDAYAAASLLSNRAIACGACRASSSIRELKLFSFDDHTLQLQFTVEHYQIGAEALLQAPSTQADSVAAMRA
jgi:hypothetical protein